MPASDTSEKGLENLIVSALTGIRSDTAPTDAADGIHDPRIAYGGAGYVLGNPQDYDRDHAVDLARLLAFLQTTQPQVFEQLGLAHDGPPKLKFLARLQGEIAKRGVVDVLRKGIKHGPASVDLFYGTPSPGNARAVERFAANIFSVTQQLRYSRDETQLALDLALFINGLPIVTFELKNRYTMKQAIQEGFIFDVLQHYTPVACYYRLAKTVEDDPEFDTQKAQKKLRHYVESHEHAIRAKAEIMVDHFHEQVLARHKLGGQARAMVVTGGIVRAIQYFHAIRDYLQERKSPYQAIVAFSGEHEYGGQKVTEASLNGFPSTRIPECIRQEPYRLLICADKFQTGYDEPLLHTMYVDKPLSGIKAVQTLSRLNRAHPKKYDTFVLDFYNEADTIHAAFEEYYRTTILSEETDPNKLHDLKADLDSYQVYDHTVVDQFVERYLGGADRDQLDPILDASVATYMDTLDESGQVDFKGKAKAFVRTYGFLASVLPFSNATWEKLSIFLNFLIPKLPAPKEEDLSQGILDAIDMESYRVEVRSAMDIALADHNAEIDPVPTAGGGRMPEPELDRLSNILRAFNDLFGNIAWKDTDKIRQVIAEEIPAKVGADKAYQNAMQHSDKQNARIEHDKALQRVLVELLSDHTELFKQFSDNAAFKKWLADMIFSVTYNPPAA